MQRLKEEREAVLAELGSHVFDWYPFDADKICLIVGENTEFIEASVAKQLKQITVVGDITDVHAKCSDNTSDVQVKNIYDYIILSDATGVSEIELAKNALAEKGKILLMADNRLGLRYFVRTADVHTNRFTQSSKDDADRQVTKKELTQMLSDAGINHYKFYYLYPDEKTTKEVFTDETIAFYGYGKEYESFDYGTVEPFSGRRMAETLCKEQMIDAFANYFVAEISDAGEFAPILYAKINGLRNPEFQIMTVILADENGKSVQKIGLTVDAIRHVQKIADYHNGDDVKKIQNGIVCEFIEDESLDDKMTQLIAAKQLDEVYGELSRFFEPYFATAVETTYATEEFAAVFGDATNPAIEKMQCIRPANIDMICENIMVRGNGYSFIDEEWIFDFYVPIKFILWRNIHELYATHATLVDLVSYEEFLKHFDIDMMMDQIFLSWSSHFINEYVGTFAYEKYAQDREFVDAQEWYLNNCNASEAKLYYDFGEGYVEKNRVSLLLETSKEGFFEVSYALPEGVQQVMWKPVELRNFTCDLEVVGGTIELVHGDMEENGTHYKGNNVEYYIRPDKNAKQLVMRGKMQMEALPTSTMEYCNRIEDLRLQYGQLRMDYDEVVNSDGWQFVLKVRRMKAKFKAPRKGESAEQ